MQGITTAGVTLGKMVLEASKEVPLPFKVDQPLVDPLDDIPESAHNSIKPIWPLFLDLDAIEDHISSHLPLSLTRHSLGFSPIGFILYLIIIGRMISVLYQLRRQMQVVFHHFKRGELWQDREIDLDGYSMEEGQALNGLPSSPSSFLPPALLCPL